MQTNGQKKTVTILLTTFEGKFARFVRGMTNSNYSHASFSLDGINFYSFNYNGFVVEHPHHMRKKLNNASMSIEISEEAYNNLKKQVEVFENNKETYKYSVVGLFLCFFHIPHKFEKKYFCSQFVAEMLSRAGAAELKKSPALYLPNQLFDGLNFNGKKSNVVCNAY